MVSRTLLVLAAAGCCEGFMLAPRRFHKSGYEEAPADAATASRVSGLGKPKILQAWRAKPHHALFRADEPECECVSHGLPKISGMTEDAPGTLAMNGPYVKRVAEDGEVSYLPHSYGSECKAWEDDLDDACKSKYPPAYCTQKWCYVDEKCKVADVKQSLFFPEKKLYYSYNNCGSFDAYTSMACLEKNQGNCQDPCAWNNGVCQNKLCQCTGDNTLTGAKAAKFGQDYGEQCKAWDKTDCETKYKGTSSLGMWCCKQWCYVDSSCPSAKPSAVAKGLYYSYFACPDVGQEMAQCPWKKPVTFSGEPLPLTSEAREALANPKRSSAEKTGAMASLVAFVLAAVSSLI